MDSFRKRLMKIHQYEKQMDHESQLTFLNRLHRLLTNGYPLIDALEAISWDEKMSQFSNEIKESLLHGKYIDEAFKAARFHKLIVMYMYFVRINGDLTNSLEKVIVLFEQRL